MSFQPLVAEVLGDLPRGRDEGPAIRLGEGPVGPVVAVVVPLHRRGPVLVQGQIEALDRHPLAGQVGERRAVEQRAEPAVPGGPVEPLGRPSAGRSPPAIAPVLGVGHAVQDRPVPMGQAVVVPLVLGQAVAVHLGQEAEVVGQGEVPDRQAHRQPQALGPTLQGQACPGASRPGRRGGRRARRAGSGSGCSRGRRRGRRGNVQRHDRVGQGPAGRRAPGGSGRTRPGSSGRPAPSKASSGRRSASRPCCRPRIKTWKADELVPRRVQRDAPARRHSRGGWTEVAFRLRRDELAGHRVDLVQLVDHGDLGRSQPGQRRRGGARGRSRAARPAAARPARRRAGRVAAGGRPDVPRAVHGPDREPVRRGTAPARGPSQVHLDPRPGAPGQRESARGARAGRRARRRTRASRPARRRGA